MRINKALSFLFLSALIALAFAPSALAASLAERLSGRILLQVEDHGEAWYVSPVNAERYYLGRPADAFRVMRDLGLGVSNRDFSAWNSQTPDRLRGRIILKVEDLGRAYYVNPADSGLLYLGRPADAFRIMRDLGLGISTANLATINIAPGHDIPILPVATPAPMPSMPPMPPLIEGPAPECPPTECRGPIRRSYELQDNECVLIEQDCSDCSCECVDAEFCEDGGVEVSGLISQDAVWTLENSPYYLTDSLEIAPGATLVIEPGVTVKFRQGPGIEDLGGISLIVSGEISAIGTADQRISFIGQSQTAEAGAWGAIEAVNGARLELEYVDIRDAATAIYAVNAAHVSLRNSVLENNLVGLYLNGSATIERNEIKNNQTGVIMANHSLSARDTGAYQNFNWLASFYYNRVSGNIGRDDGSAGIKFQDIKSPGYQFDLQYNEISANTNGLLYENTSIYSGIKVRNNNIADNLNFGVYVNTVGPDLIIRENWWGRGTSAEIDEMIYDLYDTVENLAKVDYRPFKFSPVEID